LSLPRLHLVANIELTMKRSVLFRALALFSGSALIMVLGCGYDNGLQLAGVRGKVTYRGEPVKNGTVFFMPDEGKGTIGPSATASLRDDGTYVASTDYAGDGVIVGSHKIGLTALEAVATNSGAPGLDPEKDPGGSIQAKAKSASGKPARKQAADLFTDSGGRKYHYVLPKKLSNPSESGISVRVERGSNTFNFEIDENSQVKVNP
jgi:hypothetical protein